MSFTVSWSESTPDGSESKAQGDNRIREHKVQNREFSEVDHVHPSSGVGDSTLGYHKVAHLAVQTTATAVADTGLLYTKDVSGKAELHFKDEDGNEIQLTTTGKIKSSSIQDTTPTKAGDWVISSVTTARSGWTNVSATYSDKFIRINATPLTTGGLDTHTHGVGSYTGPSHTHTTNRGTYTSPDDAPFSGAGLAQGHTHVAGAAGTGAIGGTSASANNIPAFVQVVIFQKD